MDKHIEQILSLPDDGISESKNALLDYALKSKLYLHNIITGILIFMWVSLFTISILAMLGIVQIPVSYQDIVKQIIGGSLTMGIGYLLGKK